MWIGQITSLCVSKSDVRVRICEDNLPGLCRGLLALRDPPSHALVSVRPERYLQTYTFVQSLYFETYCTYNLKRRWKIQQDDKMLVSIFLFTRNLKPQKSFINAWDDFRFPFWIYFNKISRKSPNEGVNKFTHFFCDIRAWIQCQTICLSADSPNLI